MRKLINRTNSLLIVAVLTVAYTESTARYVQAEGKTTEVQSSQEHDEDRVTGEDVRGELGDAYEAIRGFSYAKKGDFQEWAATRIDRLEPKLQNLKDHLADLDNNVKDKWNEKILPQLQNKKDALKIRLESLKTSSRKAWPHLKWGTIEALGTLEDSFEDAAKEFRNDKEDKIAPDSRDNLESSGSSDKIR